MQAGALQFAETSPRLDYERPAHVCESSLMRPLSALSESSVSICPLCRGRRGRMRVGHWAWEGGKEGTFIYCGRRGECQGKGPLGHPK